MDGEVPPERARLVLHVAEGVHLHGQGYKGHQAKHDHGQLVHNDAPGEGDVPGREPFDAVDAASRGQELRQDVPEDCESPQDGQNGQVRALTGKEAAKHCNDRECGYAKCRRKPCPLHRRCH